MTIFFITFIILLLIGVPISISIGASAVLGCLVLDYPLMVIGQKMVTGVDSYLLIAIPLFILAGNLMNAGKITDKIFSFAKELVGWIPGGLGHANIVASIIFAGMSGSAAADAGGLGTIEMEAMTKNGYRDNFSGAVTAASSVIGPIFPPSIPLIIYGATASVSVAKLFMGGVLPGLLMGVALMVLVFIFAVKYRFERHPFDIIALSKQFFGSILSLITPLIILAGFTSGSFTPTEASSIAVAYSLVIAVVVYHTIDWKAFKNCLLESAITSANTLFIIGTSTLFTYVLVKEGASKAIADFILGISSNPDRYNSAKQAVFWLHPVPDHSTDYPGRIHLWKLHSYGSFQHRCGLLPGDCSGGISHHRLESIQKLFAGISYHLCQHPFYHRNLHIVHLCTGEGGGFQGYCRLYSGNQQQS